MSDPDELQVPQFVHVPDDNFFHFSRNQTTVVCSSGEYVLKTPFDFNGERVIICAETLEIPGDIKLPGKSIDICCHTLRIGSSTRVIDVSGNPGDPKDPETIGNGLSGSTGGDAGSIRLYVQAMDPEVAQNLKLKANGGRGGLGGNTSAKDKSGGNGGDGGNGGFICFSYGHLTQVIAASIHEVDSASGSWADSIAMLQDNIVQPLASAEPAIVSGEGLSNFKLLAENAESLLEAAKLLSRALDALLSPEPNKPREVPYEIEEVVTSYNAHVQRLLSLQIGKESDEDPIQCGSAESLDNARKTVEAWFAPGSVTSDEDLTNALQLETTPIELPFAELKKNLKPLYNLVVAAMRKQQLEITNTVCSTRGGTAGAGGNGHQTGINVGDRGIDGSAGQTQIFPFSFDGSLETLNVNHAYALPEHHQMILNRANSLYFATDGKSRGMARLLYERIVNRLKFVPLLWSTEKDGVLEGKDSNLLDQYKDFQDNRQITLQIADQLTSIYSRATSMLNQILKGKDLFGFTEDFAPRLTYDFYYSRINSLIDSVKEFETKEKLYMDALKSQAKAADSLSGSVSMFERRRDHAESRIGILQDSNGPLQTAAYQITQFTPYLKEKRVAVKEALNVVAEDIKNRLQVDAGMIIDAFATLAMAPSWFTAATQGANVAHKAYTEIKDSSGMSIHKDHVITELGDAGKTLFSLSDAFQSRSDHSLEPDDPGAIKIMAEADKIQDLLKKFKDAIPAQKGDKLKEELDDYMELVKNRNSAVMDYNSALELLNTAHQDKALCDKQMETLGGEQLTLNANLPIICLWLRKARDDLKFDTMLHIDMAARAVKYWGLVDIPQFRGDGPLYDSSALEKWVKDVEKKWVLAKEKYSHLVKSKWPSDGHMGPVYRLTEGELLTLKQFRERKDSQTGESVQIHGVMITLKPHMLANSKTEPEAKLFHLKNNIRLSQVRFWVVGLKVGENDLKQELVSVQITMMGNEQIIDEQKKVWRFSSQPMRLDFEYENRDIKDLTDCTQNRALSSQMLGYLNAGDPDSKAEAAIGPFATWRFEIEKTRGLDMESIQDAYVEFCGVSRPFS
ncbi:predicted protein [Uncinocarpus reesii 1704]|uniref:Serine protein kinase n=1 Tax=Uncinocarpus reesii (strain UAMH 1704) TaxID=336963 RepID=C4JTT1_UNCRE|nr:uncharacterized protein UREG_05870 [Uncinocarpus reesii 1704]EEP81028.1 predicted protein [Uncinocarpus reesii 1704]